MKVEITLHDDNDQPVLIVSNCHQDCHEEGMVNLKLLDGLDNIEVYINDLKQALKKITAK